ncbi:MAG: MarR family transcriptional regulator [Candidatus Hydrogenedentes bacterium]|nr:MarR family transcriptional regulator [Candidatus Hydrogenedentota bacterium]
MNRCECGSGAKCGDLVGLCIALGKAMYRRAEKFFAAYDVTPSQFDILTVLSEEGMIPLNRLSESLCCACSNITGIVDRLERDGLVKRERSQEDRRVILLGLTQKGQDLWKTVPRDGCCGFQFDTILNEHEQSELRRILEKLISGMQ